MTSEIRVNKLTNRIGLSTVTFADSGIGVTVTGRIDPDTDSARDLGTTSVRWRNVYADTLYGDGSNLTGISGVSVANQANNRLITATGTTDALNGEANLTFTGSILTVTNSSGASELTLVTPSANDSGVYFNDGSNAGALTYNHSDNSMRFRVNSTEKLRITSGGQIRLPVNGQQLTWGASQQMKFYYENSEDRMYLQGDGAYGFAFRVNGGNRIEISKTTGDVTMQGSGGKNFQWDNSAADLYLTDAGSGASAKLKIGSSGDLQLYHDVGGENHIACATNQPLKVSANEFRVYDYTGVTHYMRIDNAGRLLLGGTSPELNEKLAVRGRYVNASTTTLNFNTSGSLGSSLQIRSSDSGANSIGLIEFNQGGLKSAIGSGRANAGTWGTDLRFYTHPDTTNNIHESYERLRILPSSQIRHTRSDNTTRYDLEFRQTGGLSDGNYGGIHWTQGSSGSTNLAAMQIAYQSSGQPDIVFYTRQTGGNSMQESVRFTHEGDICLNQNTNDARLGIKARSSNTGVEFITCRNTSNTLKMYVHHSGNLYNTNGNYSQISDQSLKENIVDAKSQWDDIKNIRIRNFNFTAASGMDTHTQIGCVAQEVEAVSPKLVSAPKDGVKTVANSVLYMKAVKALQEAMTRIETLEQDNIALRARITNLEGN